MTQKVVDKIIITFYVFIGLVVVLSWFGLYVDLPLNSWWLVMIILPISIGFYIIKKPKRYWMIAVVLIISILFMIQNGKGYVGVNLRTRIYDNCPIGNIYISSQGGDIFRTTVGYSDTTIPLIRKRVTEDEQSIIQECISNSVKEVTY